MRVLGLEPYYGGSHRAFLDGWRAHGRHHWTVISLPAYKWKWRMRQSAITMAWEVEARVAAGEMWDVVVCSDMLNLAEFRGLAPPEVSVLPAVAYFHENQLTYPVRFEREWDFQFGLTNITTGLSATAVWFNSDFHRQDFLGAIPSLLRKMPDNRPLEAVEMIRARSAVEPPGIVEPPLRSEARSEGPLRILWAARWEFDKGPEEFFSALRLLRDRGTDFRLSVLGQSFREAPEVFEEARVEFQERIDHWGYVPDDDYLQVLSGADVVVSTAKHEFFGLSVAESVAAGAYPLLPDRLAYPELLGRDSGLDVAEFLYDGSPRGLARRLERASEALEVGSVWDGDPGRCRRAMSRFFWGDRAGCLDDRLEATRDRDRPVRDI